MYRGIIFVSMIFISGCGSGKSDSRPTPTAALAAKEEKADQERARVSQLLEKIAAKHHAQTNWMDALAAEKGQVFSYDVQEALSEHRLIAFVAMVDDVVKIKGKYLLDLRCDLPGRDLWGREPYFNLNCERAIADWVAKHARGGESFIVVAAVSEIEREAGELRIDLHAGVGEDDESTANAAVGSRIVCHGTCLEIVPLNVETEGK
jgi:hypothetical protein